MYDQLLPTSKSLETACNYHCTHTSMPHHVSVPRSRNFSDCSPFWILLEKTTGPIIQPIQPFSQICGVTPQFFICTLTVRLCVCVYVCVCVCESAHFLWPLLPNIRQSWRSFQSVQRPASCFFFLLLFVSPLLCCLCWPWDQLSESTPLDLDPKTGRLLHV